MHRIITYCILTVCSAATLSAQKPEPGRPLEIPAVLAGNFGELRPNHFHSGLDFKTQGRTGHKIHSADDGYVSRATVSPWGFGRAVYVVHPSTGLTTVYGHLEAFSDEIDKRVRNEQYARETFSIDLEFEPGEIEVRRGDVIAFSGNAGSSFGPHLHMDIRDTRTGDALDPMEYYRNYINDKTPPEVRHIGLYPVTDEGSVNGSNAPSVPSKADAAKGFDAWGKVYPAINAFDRMTGTNNIYGVKYLTLTVDGKQVYRRVIDRFSFDNTRAVNTLADYGDVVDRGRWMMRTYVCPSRPLGDMIEAVGDGTVTIDTERPYKFKFTLEDAFGNKTEMPFTVRGRKTDIKQIKTKGNRLNFDGTHSYNVDGVSVSFPKGVLYDDIIFRVDSVKSENYNSLIYTIGDYRDPLAGNIPLTIPLKNDCLTDKTKYCLVRLSGKKRSAVTSRYENGAMKAEINRFGRYAVTSDITPPSIVAVRPETWGKGAVTFRISDNLSGVETFRGEIDGKFALFEFDGKSGRVTFKMDPRRFSRGKLHTVTMTVTDACGNQKTETRKFKW